MAEATRTQIPARRLGGLEGPTHEIARSREGLVVNRKHGPKEDGKGEVAEHVSWLSDADWRRVLAVQPGRQ